jgi:hypothetical protein
VALGELYAIVPELKTRIHEFALSALVAHGGAIAAPIPQGLSFTTESCQWCYSLTTELPPAARADSSRPIIVRARLTLHKGQIAIAAANVANQSKLLSRVSVSPRSLMQTVDLKIDSPDRIGQMILINESPRGSSEGLIHSIEIYAAD